MTEYKVTWIIDIDAETPEDAAAEALNIQRDVESQALFFRVLNKDTDEEVGIDLIDAI